jgi:hypothetical protein
VVCVSNAAGNILQILANLPDFLRKPMLHNKLKEFYTMTDDDRRETIRTALSAAPTIDPKKLSVLFRTWLEVIAEFDPEKRATMFETYCIEMLANAHQVEKLDFKSLTATFLSLDQKHQERLTDSMHEVLLSFPKRNEILKLVPTESLKALRLK